MQLAITIISALGTWASCAHRRIARPMLRFGIMYQLHDLVRSIFFLSYLQNKQARLPCRRPDDMQSRHVCLAMRKHRLEPVCALVLRSRGSFGCCRSSCGIAGFLRNRCCRSCCFFRQPLVLPQLFYRSPRASRENLPLLCFPSHNNGHTCRDLPLDEQPMKKETARAIRAKEALF